VPLAAADLKSNLWLISVRCCCAVVHAGCLDSPWMQAASWWDRAQVGKSMVTVEIILVGYLASHLVESSLSVLLWGSQGINLLKGGLGCSSCIALSVSVEGGGGAKGGSSPCWANGWPGLARFGGCV